jgi:hypothetical protein
MARANSTFRAQSYAPRSDTKVLALPSHATRVVFHCSSHCTLEYYWASSALLSREICFNHCKQMA